MEDAAAHGIPVEGELGSIGGKEDSLVSKGNNLTDPDDAVRFVEETGVYSLAVAIGTAHGVYKETPHLDVERLKVIRGRVQHSPGPPWGLWAYGGADQSLCGRRHLQGELCH